MIVSGNRISSAVTPDKSLDSRLFPYREDSSELTVRCMRAQYSASLIARAVEDADAHLLNLNVTSDVTDNPGEIVVELRVSHRHPMSVARSLERYGFEVVTFKPGNEDPLAATAIERLGELMSYLKV
ncbi:MAG: hypothetical protein K2M05_02795 [Paramuribaculum sp.]|nr:hypothetical protein [Paramuribaculum sp.]